MIGRAFYIGGVLFSIAAWIGAVRVACIVAAGFGGA